MSSAPSSVRNGSATVLLPDLDYAPSNYVHGGHRDTDFLVQRVEAAVMAEVARARPRVVVDAGCGMGLQAARMAAPGRVVCGVEASGEMIGAGRFLDTRTPVRFVRGVAEALPIADASTDVVVTQGALDHFADPHSFAAEAARALRPGGRLVVALTNYDSLSCRLGRSLHRLPAARARQNGARPYWQVPEDHTVKGNAAFLLDLAPQLRRRHTYGISLFWLFTRWGVILDRLPEGRARGLWNAMDFVARRRPALADMVVTVWSRA